MLRKFWLSLLIFVMVAIPVAGQPFTATGPPFILSWGGPDGSPLNYRVPPGVPGVFRTGASPADLSVTALGNWTYQGNLNVLGNCSGCGPVVLNVKNYGAVGDGSHDDTSAIQTAFNDPAAVNGTIYFPNGTYHLAGAACALTAGTNAKDLAIIGQSRSGTVIDAASCPNSLTVLTTNYLGNTFILRNITIQANVNTGMTGLHVQDRDFYMDNVGLDNFTNTAAALEVTRCYISNSAFNGVGPGGASKGLNIISAGNRCDLQNVYTSGLFIGSSGNTTKNVHVAASLLDDHNPQSVLINGSTTSDIHIEDSIIFTNGGGIGLQVGDGVTTPARVSVLNTLIGPFTTGYAELWNVQINAGATDTVLQNVTTQVQNAGGDISDSGTNTRIFNVTRNGTFGGSGGTYNWIQQGTAVMGTTEKIGTGAGNYTTTSATFVNVDGTNLTTGAITIPIGWNDTCKAITSVDTSTLGATLGIAIADGGTVKREQTMTQAVASDFAGLSVQWTAPGDGASHTITLQWKVSAGTATMANSTATLLPTMTCTLMPFT